MGTFSVSAATVTLDTRGRILLIRRADNGQWQIPGGVVELGENPPDAASRETFEETGFHVEPVQLTGIYTHTVRGIVALVFLARTRGGAATLSDEATAVEWFFPEEATALVPEVFRPRVRDALTHSDWLAGGATSPVAFRPHDGAVMADPPE